MSETTIKQIENFVRNCVLDFSYWWWTRGHKNQHRTPEPKKILCIELGCLGDQIAITPALKSLSDYYPFAHITLLTLSDQVDTLKGLPFIHEIVPEIPNDLLRFDWLVVFYAGRVWHLKKYQRLQIIPFKIGVANHGMASSHFPNLDRKVKYPHEPKHMVESNLDVIRLVVPEHAIQKRMYLASRGNIARDYLNGTREYVPTKRTIILHPGSKGIDKYDISASHFWPYERWAAVADYFIKDYNIIITGTMNEMFLYRSICNSMQDSRNVICCFGFDKGLLFSLIKKADLIISIDSGPVHISSGFFRPIISLMGPELPEIWRPWSKNGKYLFHDEVCTRCRKLRCKYGSAKCMQAITIKEVISFAEELLSYTK
mgnify:CR=1 FL=1